MAEGGGLMVKRKRHPVLRAARIPATSQTVAKSRGCVIRRLYESREIDGAQQEAAWEIAEAFRLLTAYLGVKPVDLDRIGASGRETFSERASRLTSIYVAWARDFGQRAQVRPHVIVEMIEMERPIDSLPLLRRALDAWRAAAIAVDRHNRKRAS